MSSTKEQTLNIEEGSERKGGVKDDIYHEYTKEHSHVLVSNANLPGM